MKSVTINERAAANAMEFVVGPQARMVIENLYGVINSAMNDAYAHGVQDGSRMEGTGAAYNDGYMTGYNDGVEIATGGEQPEVDFADQHDSGDETPELPDEIHSVDELPPMQEQKSNPFSWSPGPVTADGWTQDEQGLWHEQVRRD